MKKLKNIICIIFIIIIVSICNNVYAVNIIQTESYSEQQKALDELNEMLQSNYGCTEIITKDKLKVQWESEEYLYTVETQIKTTLNGGNIKYYAKSEIIKQKLEGINEVVSTGTYNYNIEEFISCVFGIFPDVEDENNKELKYST